MNPDELLGIMMSMDDSELSRESILKAPFGWPGGKVASIPKILPHLPYTPYWRDVFGGSGCITLARNKVKHEVFNDRHSGVCDFYRCVKDAKLCKALLEWLDFTPFSREEFLRCKGTWKNTVDPVERAARWYCSVQMSFQSLGRNFGRAKDAKSTFSMKLPNSLKSFWPVHYRLMGTYIENQDWRDILRDWDHHQAVFYLDPPYLGAAEQYEHTMTSADHQEMCERIHALQGYAALSGYDNPIYRRFPWDEVYSWEVRSTTNASVGTSTNNRSGSEGNNNETREEFLFIKKFSKH